MKFLKKVFGGLKTLHGRVIFSQKEQKILKTRSDVNENGWKKKEELPRNYTIVELRFTLN